MQASAADHCRLGGEAGRDGSHGIEATSDRAQVIGASGPAREDCGPRAMASRRKALWNEEHSAPSCLHAFFKAAGERPRAAAAWFMEQSRSVWSTSSVILMGCLLLGNRPHFCRGTMDTSWAGVEIS